MSRPPVPFSMIFSAVAALWAPIAFALAVLVSAGWLSRDLGAATAVILAVALAFIVRPYLADLLALRAYVEDVGRRDDAPAPQFTFRTIPAEVSAMIGRLQRIWLAERDHLKEVASATAAVLDSLPDPLLLLDSARQVIRANHAARDLLGPNVAGRDLSAVLRNPDVLAAADLVLAGRKESSVELALAVPVERIFLAGIIALESPTAEGVVAILRLHDLTEIKRTEQMRADFVANVSHELKTPLTTLLGYIETLRGPARDDREATDKFLSIMNQQAARMNSLVEDLLSLSRIELHEHKAPTGQVDLANVLGSVVDLFQNRASAKGQKIELSLPAQPQSTIGDPVELSQVFENLIGNAVRYSGPKSTIRVSMRPVSPGNGAGEVSALGRVAVAVADEGAGIPKEHLPRLTERFYRVDAARSRELGGTGLGLAIVKHIVNRHRGDLKIESEIGKGSTFTVILPAATRSSE